MNLSESFDYTILYYIAIGAIVIGSILFILTGFIHVKKGHSAVIEKLEQFYGVYEPGFHYFAPFIYRRVGMYQKSPYEIQTSVCGNIIKIKIQIMDVKVYHYSHIKISDLVQEESQKTYQSIDEFIISLQMKLKSIGCSLIK